MPTSAASFETWPRIFSAISATSFSGSGSEALMALRLVEETLQDDGGGERVHVRLAPRARARLAKLRFGGRRRERLVHQHDLELVASREAPRELPGELRDRVLRSVRMSRLPDNECDRAPLAHVAIDRREARLVGLGLDRAQGIGDARRGLAYGDAHALRTVVEGEDRSRDRHHA